MEIIPDVLRYLAATLVFLGAGLVLAAGWCGSGLWTTKPTKPAWSCIGSYVNLLSGRASSTFRSDTVNT